MTMRAQLLNRKNEFSEQRIGQSTSKIKCHLMRFRSPSSDVGGQIQLFLALCPNSFEAPAWSEKRMGKSKKKCKDPDDRLVNQNVQGGLLPLTGNMQKISFLDHMISKLKRLKLKTSLLVHFANIFVWHVLGLACSIEMWTALLGLRADLWSSGGTCHSVRITKYKESKIQISCLGIPSLPHFETFTLFHHTEIGHALPCKDGQKLQGVTLLNNTPSLLVRTNPCGVKNSGGIQEYTTAWLRSQR